MVHALSLSSMSCARCGLPFDPKRVWAFSPGSEAVYGQARDALGEPDPRLPPIVLSAPVATLARHWPMCEAYDA